MADVLFTQAHKPSARLLRLPPGLNHAVFLAVSSDQCTPPFLMLEGYEVAVVGSLARHPDLAAEFGIK